MSVLLEHSYNMKGIWHEILGRLLTDLDFGIYHQKKNNVLLDYFYENSWVFRYFYYLFVIKLSPRTILVLAYLH